MFQVIQCFIANPATRFHCSIGCWGLIDPLAPAGEPWGLRPRRSAHPGSFSPPEYCIGRSTLDVER